MHRATPPLPFLVLLVPAALLAHAARGAEQTRNAPPALAWVHQADHAPSPAFKGGLAPRGRRVTPVEPMTLDYAFQPVVAGGRVYFGSSTEDAVFCLDAATGRTLWSFYAEGPVRLAPTLHEDRLCFGSDDGYVYCLRASDGTLLWRIHAAPDRRRVVGNLRVISAWPVRTSVLVHGGVAYFGAGLFPPMGTWICAANAETGELLWRRPIPYSPNGNLIPDDDWLLLATGRTAPAELRLADGAPLIPDPDRRRAQGASRLRRLAGMPVWGPCESGILHFRLQRGSPPPPRKPYGSALSIGTVTGLRAFDADADGRTLYIAREHEILAVPADAFRRIAGPETARTSAEGMGFRRPWGIAAAGQLLRENPAFPKALEAAADWSVQNPDAARRILAAGETLACGADGKVLFLDAASGRTLASHPVEGAALALAAVDGAFYAATDTGHIYAFRPGAIADPPHTRTPAFRNPWPGDPLIAEAAETALAAADTKKGVALLLGAGTGHLAAEIARRSEFSVLCIEPDAAVAARARENLAAAGLYGARVAVHHVPDPRPPYLRWFANLIVSPALLRGDPLPYEPDAVLRMLQPEGGAVVLASPKTPLVLADWRAPDLSQWKTARGPSGTDWHVARRGALPGAGAWTHMYADPANTCSSGDRLVTARLQLQWFGPPGAEDVVERHALAMPPLSVAGRLFVTGLYDTLRGMDAYNGTTLWKIKVTDSTRRLMSHTAGFVAADPEHVFIASGKTCWMLDPATGEKRHVFSPPHAERDWGYVATRNGILYGTTQKQAATAALRPRGRGARLVNARLLESRPVVAPDLFAFDAASKKLLWHYETGSVILHPTLTLSPDTIFFAESRCPDAVADEVGAPPLPTFFARGAALVALDARTGALRWRIPLEQKSPDYEHMMFLSWSDGLLLSTRTYYIDKHISYELRVLDAATGRERWGDFVKSPKEGPYAPLSYGKNHAQAHPAIVDGRIYWLAHVWGTVFCHELATGKTHHDPDFGTQWQNKGCAVPTASASALFYRHTSCHAYDIATREKVDLTGETRPSCWMSMIPAGGLLLMPEAGSGCSCGIALQTSVALAPVEQPE
jgi:outer membrane protein assembly factor BamB